jgi:polysaccharide biosynthesis/export protein
MSEMKSRCLERWSLSRWVMAGWIVWSAMCSLTAQAAMDDNYVLRAGDVVNVTVWGVPELDRALLIRPDGGVSFPFASNLQAAGQTVAQLTKAITAKLKQYISDPVVTVALQENFGNKIYVTGRVVRPGVYQINQDVDVLQAIALAGGLTPFADRDDIKILRREKGVERAIPFNFKQVQRGERLEQNIILHPGDTVLVP